jgi:hypothetical protein
MIGKGATGTLTVLHHYAEGMIAKLGWRSIKVIEELKA